MHRPKMTTLFINLLPTKKHFGILNAGAIVGVLCMLIVFYALYRLEETFHKDLNYIEE